jgi:Fe2+ or Zn2+ uptake regulation protein
MDNEQFQDAVAYSQKLMKEITDEGTIQLFKDKNLSRVIEFLRTHKGAMTVPELEESFKKINEEKSDKTIYRYLKKLEDAGLVIQAGKRVFASETKVKTQTLYMRSAKVFYIVKPEDEEEACPEEKKLTEALGISIGKKMNLKLKSVECLEKFLKRFKVQYSSYPREIIKNAEDEITHLLEDLDFEYSKSLIEMISLLALLNDRIEWQKDLMKCFE